MKLVRRALLGTLLTPALLASACSSDDQPELPPPTVGTADFEHRLDEHLSRFASLLQPDAQVSAPAHSRAEGCDGGPSWAVVPQAEVTVNAGAQAEKLFDDLQDWMSRNGFDGLYEDDGWQTGNPAGFREAKGTHTDGTQVLEHLDRDAPQFTVTVTGPCTWPPGRPGGPAPGRLAPLPAPSEPTSSIGPTSSVDSETCLSPKLYVYNTSAPAFAGPGPHPMVMSVYTGIKEHDSPTFVYDNLYLPDGWDPDDEQQAQLVVCVHVNTTSDTGRKVSCNYTTDPLGRGGGVPYDFEVFESTYHVTVRDARSGAVVGDFSLPGKLDDAKSCPYQLQNNLAPLARGLDDNAFERALRPLYESAR